MHASRSVVEGLQVLQAVKLDLCIIDLSSRGMLLPPKVVLKDDVKTKKSVTCVPTVQPGKDVAMWPGDTKSM